MEQWIKDVLFETNAYYSNIGILWILTAVVVVYVLLVIPCGYAVLKKKNAIGYLREFLIVSAILFSGIIFVVGARTRITAPTFNYVRVIKEGETNSETVYASVQLPYKQSAELDFVSGYTVVTDASQQTTSQNVKRTASLLSDKIYKKQGTTGIRIESTAVLSPEYVELVKKEKTDKKITAFARKNGDGYTVKIDNASDYTIISAVLYDNGTYISLDGVENGKEKNYNTSKKSDEVLEGLVKSASADSQIIILLELTGDDEDIISDTTEWDVDGRTYAIVFCQEGQ